MSNIEYRFEPYHKLQHEEIIELFTQTFTDSEGEKEGEILGVLVEDLLTTTPELDLKVCVATENRKIIACIFFTPLGFETDTIAYLLSPVATLTQYQGKGIGQGLINFGLQFLKRQHVELIFTYGDPNFYSKVGFKQITQEQFQAPYPLSYPHGWLAQSLNAQPLGAIAGKSFCAAGLNKAAYW